MPGTRGKGGNRPGSASAGAGPRFVLPADLRGALRGLEDAQLEALLRAASDEARWRGWKTGEAGARSQVGTKACPVRPGLKAAGERAPPLTPGQERVVRAALEAGARPAAIAGQFGIARSSVQHVAAELKRRK